DDAPPREAAMSRPSDRVERGFDRELAGRRAECDGGGLVPGTKYVGRQEFTGTLTGEYVDHGDPAWRWYLMVDLAEKPDGFEAEGVWCESQSLFLIDEPAG
ncbi:MAG: hypothetical protein ACE5FL_00695, partial [Myxococcota bacterium]